MALVQGALAAVTGTLATANASVGITTDSNSTQGVGTIGVQLSGTFSATVAFEATNDGTNWFAVSGLPAGGGQAAQTATAAGQWQIPVLGYAAFRARCSSFTSGSVVVGIDASVGVLASSPLPNGGGFKDTTNLSGNQSAPTAATAIFTAAAPGVAGQYLINVVAGLSLGTPAAGDVANMGLYKNTTLVQTLVYPTSGMQAQPPIKLTLTASDTLVIKAIGNATASVNYSAALTATLVA